MDWKRPVAGALRALMLSGRSWRFEMLQLCTALRMIRNTRAVGNCRAAGYSYPLNSTSKLPKLGALPPPPASSRAGGIPVDEGADGVAALAAVRCDVVEDEAIGTLPGDAHAKAGHPIVEDVSLLPVDGWLGLPHHRVGQPGFYARPSLRVRSVSAGLVATGARSTGLPVRMSRPTSEWGGSGRSRNSRLSADSAGIPSGAHGVD